jgi:hypothetical protein
VGRARQVALGEVVGRGESKPAAVAGPRARQAAGGGFCGGQISPGPLEG